MKNLVCVIMVLAVLAPTVCHAWGPEASQAITLAALQTIRRTYPDALGGSEAALFKGSRISGNDLMTKFVYAGNVATPAVVVKLILNSVDSKGITRITDNELYQIQP